MKVKRIDFNIPRLLMTSNLLQGAPNPFSFLLLLKKKAMMYMYEQTPYGITLEFTGLITATAAAAAPPRSSYSPARFFPLFFSVLGCVVELLAVHVYMYRF